MDWCRGYRNEGLSGLPDQRSGGNNAKLTASQRQEAKHHLHTYSPDQLFGDQTATPGGSLLEHPEFAAGLKTLVRRGL